MRTIETFRDLIGTIGLQHPDELRRSRIHRRMDDLSARSFEAIHSPLKPGALLAGEMPDRLALARELASVDRF